MTGSGLRSDDSVAFRPRTNPLQIQVKPMSGLSKPSKVWSRVDPCEGERQPQMMCCSLARLIPPNDVRPYLTNVTAERCA